MQFNGQPLPHSFTRTVQLPRPDGTILPLTLSPLPLGFHARLRKNGVAPPQPPTRVARDSAGQPLRDRQGLAVLVADDHDAGYLEELELYHQRVAILVLAEALRNDPNIEFDNPPPPDSPPGTSLNSCQPATWPSYADDLYAELQAAGWTAGDLIHVCHEISRLSNLLTDHVQEAQQNFSSGAIPTTSPKT